MFDWLKIQVMAWIARSSFFRNITVTRTDRGTILITGNVYIPKLVIAAFILLVIFACIVFAMMVAPQPINEFNYVA